jgi:tetratricopeptide (TPR) repeat protein
MAEECGAAAAAGPLVEMEKQVILCQEARVASQGEARAQAAAEGLAYLKEHPAAPARLVLAVAELCYDVGHRGHDPKWYEDATRLCQQVVAHPVLPEEAAQARHIMAVSQPYERRGDRIAELRRAYGLLEHAAAEDREASRWFAQIMTSLAKELGKGTAQERSEAQRLFECRLQMDPQRQLDDVRGTAMAVAGLGRLEWYAQPKNVAAAEQHFARNLELSEAIGDVIAQVKMHSLLGACALEKGDIEPAATHYRRSWELAGDPLDRVFACVGLLRCYQRQSRGEPFQAMLHELCELLRRVTLPAECANPLRAVLESCPAESRSKEVEQLLDLVGHMTSA